MQKGWRFIDFGTTICRLAGKRKIADVSGAGLVAALDAEITGPDCALETVYLAHLLIRRLKGSRALEQLRAPGYNIEAISVLTGLQDLCSEALKNMPTGDAAG